MSDPDDGARRATRDRRGRGPRGPGVMPEHPGRPRTHPRRDRFDRMVLDVVSDLEDRWRDHLGLVEYAVEEAPQVPDDWESAQVPLASLVRGAGTRPTRLVVFRRPIEQRARTRTELAALVHAVVVEQVADLLGVEPHVVDPRLADEE